MQTPPQPHLWTRSGHLTALALEQRRCEDLKADERAVIDAHLAGCLPCADALAGLQQETLPPLPWLPTHAANTDQTHQKPRPSRARPYWLGGLIAAAAAVSLVVWLVPSEPTTPYTEPTAAPPFATNPPDDIRIKGSPFSLEVLAHHPTQGARTVRSGDTVAPGERLGFKVSARSKGFLMIVGFDERGQSYLCYPQHNQHQAAPLGPTDQPLGLNEAVRLDEVLGHERIVGLFCEEPFALEDLPLSSPTPAAAGALRPGCVQAEVSLIKR